MFYPNFDQRLKSAGLSQEIVDRIVGIVDRLVFVNGRNGRKVTRHEDGQLIRTVWDLTCYDCTRYVQALAAETDPVQQARLMRGDLVGRVGNIAGALYWHETERFLKARADELRIELLALRETCRNQPATDPIRSVLVELACLVRQYSGAVGYDRTASSQLKKVPQNVLGRHFDALRDFYEVAVQGLGDYSYDHFDQPVIELTSGPVTALELSAALMEARVVRTSYERCMTAYHQAKSQRNPPQFASRLEEALRAEAFGNYIEERMNRSVEIKLQQADAEACFLAATAAVEQTYGALEKAKARLTAAVGGETSDAVRAEFKNFGYGFNQVQAESAKRMVNCIAARYWLHQMNVSAVHHEKAKMERSFSAQEKRLFDELAYVDSVLNPAPAQ